MSMDLNLLPSRAKFQAAKIKLKQRVTWFNWIFVSAWFLIVLVVLLISFINKTRLDSADKNLALEEGRYNSLADDASISYQIKYVAKLVGKVLNDRFEYGTSIKKINNLFSPGIELTDYQIGKTNKFNLSGSISDGSKMDEVEQTVKDINNGKMPDFTSAKLSSVAIGKDGVGWIFEMEVQLK